MAPPRAVDVDRGPVCRVETGGTEAADTIATAAVARGEGVVERPLALAPPHQAVDVVGPQVVFGEAEPEVAGVGVAVTGERSEEGRVGKEGRSRWSPDH